MKLVSAVTERLNATKKTAVARKTPGPLRYPPINPKSPLLRTVEELWQKFNLKSPQRAFYAGIVTRNGYAVSCAKGASSLRKGPSPPRMNVTKVRTFFQPVSADSRH